MPLLKEKEDNQHPIAYAPVKFKKYIQQEPEDEEQCCESKVAEDLTQEVCWLLIYLINFHILVANF